MSRNTSEQTSERPTSLDDVPGWFHRIDRDLFTWILEDQASRDIAGDLLEIGCYLGKSAILMGRHLRPDETFTVCDLFESGPVDDANRVELRRSYSALTRAAFEANYLAFHEDLPTIVEGPSSIVAEHVRPRSCRLAHVDGSHLYEHVRTDIETARAVLAPDGIVICDDYRAQHTPGVAAAVWQAVGTTGLRPFCLTPSKFYGTWGDPEPIREELLARLAERPQYWHEVQHIAGEPVIRTNDREQSRAAERERARARLEEAREANARLRKALAARQRKLDALRGSSSYRLGRALATPVRKLRRLSRDRRS